MNHLAHCLLAYPHEDILTGNFVADFITARQEPLYTGSVMEGIRLHRLIDSYTDRHPSSLALRAMLRQRHRKYAPVVVDLIWDHILSLNWTRYSTLPLREFADRVYTILASNHDIFPVMLQQRLGRMIDSDFLLAYANEERMLSSLAWMDRRARFPSNFVSAVEDVHEHREMIQELFEAFFPQIQERVEQWLAERG